MKVLIVDDHAIVHAGLRRLIAVEPDAEIPEAVTAKEALASFKEDRPDLVIMDLNLPGSGRLEMIRRLTIEDESVRILVLQRARRLDSCRARLRGRRARICDKERAAGSNYSGHLPRRRRAHYIEPEIAQELALLSPGRPAVLPYRIPSTT
jgi:two-component system, NarL family, invasion response regulator UvrY